MYSREVLVSKVKFWKAQVERFIATGNMVIFNQQEYDEIVKNYNQDRHAYCAGCPYIFTRGPREGQFCGKGHGFDQFNYFENNGFCKQHQNRNTSFDHEKYDRVRTIIDSCQNRIQELTRLTVHFIIDLNDLKLQSKSLTICLDPFTDPVSEKLDQTVQSWNTETRKWITLFETKLKLWEKEKLVNQSTSNDSPSL